MKNITVSVPDDVYYAARVRAAEMRTTVSALVREQLVELAGRPPELQERQRRLLDTIRRIAAGQRARPADEPFQQLSREELHQRGSLGE